MSTPHSLRQRPLESHRPCSRTALPSVRSLDFLEKHADESAAFWEKADEEHEEGDEEGAPGGAAEAKVRRV